jgi:hypothetical protein
MEIHAAHWGDAEVLANYLIFRELRGGVLKCIRLAAEVLEAVQSE